MSWTIEGTWTGYTSAQRQVVHREHTRSTKRVDAIKQLGSIGYSDGTRLLLNVSDGKSGAAMNGYGSLIADCIKHGVNHVDSLPSGHK